MSIEWNATSGANRLVMIVVAAVLGALLIGAMVLWDHSQKNDAVAAQTPPPKESDASVTPTTASRGQVQSNTTTTLFEGMTEWQIENPEASFMNGPQLARVYNQSNSGLSLPSYEAGVRMAKEFAEASATGNGAE